MNIGVIIASTRPTRKGGQVAEWVKSHTDKDSEATYTYLDLAEIHLPFLNEPNVPGAGNYQEESTKNWAAKIGAQDGFLIVTPEYNHGVPAPLKNALDTLFAEWTKKPVGFVSYGAMGGVRSLEHLMGTLLNLEMVPLNATGQPTNIMLFHSLDEQGNFVANDQHDAAVEKTLTSLKKWTAVLRDNRDKL